MLFYGKCHKFQMFWQFFFHISQLLAFFGAFLQPWQLLVSFPIFLATFTTFWHLLAPFWNCLQLLAIFAIFWLLLGIVHNISLQDRHCLATFGIFWQLFAIILATFAIFWQLLPYFGNF